MSKYPPEAEEMADDETDSDDASDTALQATSGGCPACGYNHKGVANCCSHGGSWEGKCATDISLSGAQHTWIDGYNACNSLIVAAAGCTDSLSTNYVAEANVDDGSCLSFGCTDSLMANYDPTATEDDGPETATSHGCASRGAISSRSWRAMYSAQAGPEWPSKTA